MKIEVEIDESLIPEGYEVVRIGVPKTGEEYLENGQRTQHVKATFDYRSLVCAIIRKKQPTYAERQAAWVKEHGIKPGSKVRVIREAESKEDGWRNTWERPMSGSVGETLTVALIAPGNNGIQLQENVGFVFPYFVLEPAKEPEYVPYSFHTMPVEGIKVKHTGGLETFYVVEPLDGKNAQFRRTWAKVQYSALLDHFVHLDGTPCGVKVGE